MITQQYPDVSILSKHLDVSDEKSVEDFYTQAASKFGEIDFAAHVAGVGQAATPIHLVSDDVFDKIYRVNQRGVSAILKI